MTQKEAMDWLFSTEAEQEYPDYMERWKAAVRKSLQPLYDRAEKEGLWFFINPQNYDDVLDETSEYGFCWPPEKLKAMQDNEELLFWANTFELRPPNEQISQNFS